MRNLDKLNEFLAADESLPPFRRFVPASLGNINWLRSKYKPDNPEVLNLLSLTDKQLLEAVQ